MGAQIRTVPVALRGVATAATALALLLVAGCGQQASPETGPVGASSSATASASDPSSSAASSSTATASGSAATATATAAGPAATGTGASSSVVITAPTDGEQLPAGVIGVVGQGSAPEGTLLWKITAADGSELSSGYTDAGANGEVGDFTVQQTVQKGSCTPCTASVWVPDESSGESTVPSSAAKVTFSVD